VRLFDGRDERGRDVLNDGMRPSVGIIGPQLNRGNGVRVGILKGTRDLDWDL
jgi:hypothetical protein